MLHAVGFRSLISCPTLFCRTLNLNQRLVDGQTEPNSIFSVYVFVFDVQVVCVAKSCPRLQNCVRRIFCFLSRKNSSVMQVITIQYLVSTFLYLMSKPSCVVKSFPRWQNCLRRIFYFLSGGNSNVMHVTLHEANPIACNVCVSVVVAYRSRVLSHLEKRNRINVLNTLMSRHHYRNILLAVVI